MTITERTLVKWRKEALVGYVGVKEISIGDYTCELEQRILRLTQELLDAHLIRKVSR